MAYPIPGLTEKEELVLTEITKQCMADYSASVRYTAKKSGLPVETVKGVIGSLVKKGHAATEQGEGLRSEFYDVFAVFGGQWLCYGDESGYLKASDLEIATKVAEWTPIARVTSLSTEDPRHANA